MDLAAAVIREALAAGVRHFCVCAGSRNSPLVLTLLDILEAPSSSDSAASSPKFYHFFEERCAAFFALGLARQTESPAAVLTTSGTAAAELFPAMIEAHYQGLPLLAITADRPRRFRGSGAPQAIEQHQLFSSYPVLFADVAQTSEAAGCLRAWNRRGPAHLNVCLEDPAHSAQSATQQPPTDVPPAATFSSPENSAGDAADCLTKLRSFLERHAVAGPLLVLAGDLLPAERPWAAQLLQRIRPAAVWAEDASGLRCDALPGGGWQVRGGDSSLRRLPVRAVVRIGGVPSCRYWRDLEDHPDIPVFSCSRSGHSGLARHSDVVPLGFSIGELPAAKTVAFSPVDRSRDERQDPAGLLAEFPESECAMLRRLGDRIPAASRLFLGNSLAIREWNLVAGAQPRRETHVLRGANGIDGNLSYFLGISEGAEESWAVVGDLTALYDLAAPWILPQLGAGRRRIVVINNGGGKIFSRLPSLRGLAPDRRRVVENAHSLRLESWARLWGMEYVRLPAGERWPDIPDAPAAVLELLPDPAQSEAFWERMASLEREIWK